VSPDTLGSLAQLYGPMGLLVAYLIWSADRREKRWKEHEEQRLKQDAARTEADKGLALALQALTIAIRRDV
jgi:hypothetical protein